MGWAIWRFIQRSLSDHSWSSDPLGLCTAVWDTFNAIKYLCVNWSRCGDPWVTVDFSFQAFIRELWQSEGEKRCFYCVRCRQKSEQQDFIPTQSSSCEASASVSLYHLRWVISFYTDIHQTLSSCLLFDFKRRMLAAKSDVTTNCLLILGINKQSCCSTSVGPWDALWAFLFDLKVRWKLVCL